MNALTGPGLVLRRNKRAEDDVRLTVFFREHGKVFATSKGGQKAKSVLKAIQEPFTEADFHVFAPEHGVNGRLGGGKLIDSHQGIRTRFAAFETASRVCEVVDVLVPFRAASPEVYDILRSALRSLSTGAQVDYEWVLFVARLLASMGHGDVSDRLTALLEGKSPSEVQPESLERCLNLVNAELEQILPWRLKSDRAAVIEGT